jgi:hypothetical protein
MFSPYGLYYLTLPPARTASLDFDPGFVLVIRSRFRLSFTLTSFAVSLLYGRTWFSVAKYKQAFFMLAFCIMHFKSTSAVTLISHVHLISCFSFSSHIVLSGNCHCQLIHCLQQGKKYDMNPPGAIRISRVF